MWRSRKPLRLTAHREQAEKNEEDTLKNLIKLAIHERKKYEMQKPFQNGFK
jgi:hypothetical protein